MRYWRGAGVVATSILCGVYANLLTAKIGSRPSWLALVVAGLILFLLPLVLIAPRIDVVKHALRKRTAGTMGAVAEALFVLACIASMFLCMFVGMMIIPVIIMGDGRASLPMMSRIPGTAISWFWLGLGYCVLLVLTAFVLRNQKFPDGSVADRLYTSCVLLAFMFLGPLVLTFCCFVVFALVKLAGC
jgi:hypothetical protein